ncbi:glycosyltransferase family 4 protein [Undibacterium sp. TJN19]|uniref:glycosyltransferase family 4 protein n=1 Tax=Undibacterium sp. TJN19 TaxID=3413055 RepID=UPI003BF1AE9B
MSLQVNNNALNVMLVSTSYPKNAQDWQGRFIADMLQSLSEKPNLKLSLWAPPGEVPANVATCLDTEDARQLNDMLAGGGIAHIVRSKGLRGIFHVFSLLRMLRQAYRRQVRLDVAHVNWLQNALPLWGSKTPALVTVLGTDFALLSLPGMQTLLRIVLRQRSCIIAPNAEWMQAKLQQAFGDLAEIRVIPFGVEKKWFTVQRRVPANAPKKWLVVTRITQKKLGHLLDWCQGLMNEHRELHLFGPMQEQITLPDWIHYHGPTNPTALSTEWFPQAAGLLTLSQHDEGRPQVLLEAMAAGLPVIVSDIPGHRSLVRDQQTGWICDSPDKLRQALDFLDMAENNTALGKAAQDWIKTEIGTWDDCASRYETAYRDLMRKS